MENSHSNESILLVPLSLNNAKDFYNLYASQNKVTHKPVAETPMEFTKRIISECNCIFTIRTVYNKDKIIGDCALHHWNKEMNEIEIGGTLLSTFRGRGIMASAFEILTDMAKQEYLVTRLIAKTEIINFKALKFAKKNGFNEIEIVDKTIILAKMI